MENIVNIICCRINFKSLILSTSFILFFLNVNGLCCINPRYEFNCLELYNSPKSVEKLDIIEQSTRKYILIQDGNSQETEIHDKNVVWHKQNEKILRSLYSTLKKIDSSSNHNIANFNIRLLSKSSDEIFSCSLDQTFFISGGNLNLLNDLKKEYKNFEFQCIGNYCPLEPGKPKDSGLRKNIADFFGFEEKLTPSQKEQFAKVFKDSLADRVTFDEFSLKEKPIKQIVEASQSALDRRFFTDQANDFAQKIGLINKADKSSRWHIDDLFGSAFQLNFADSEQAIRLFIENNIKDIKFGYSPIEQLVTHLSKSCKVSIEEYQNIEKDIRTLKKNQKKNANEIHKKQEKLNTLHSSLNEKIEDISKEYLDSIWIEINISSYYDMCGNCNAIFRYDTAVKRQLQKNVFTKIIKDVVETEDNKIVKGFLVSNLAKSEKAQDNIFLKTAKVSLVVSGLERYN